MTGYTVKKYDFGVSRKWSYCYGAKDSKTGEVEERETKDDVSRNWDTFLSLANTYICAKKR